MLDFLLAAIFGVISITILDRYWFKINYKKAEKGLEILEHYHHGIIMIIISMWVYPFIPILTIFLAVGGATFIYREARQENDFAHNSTHFKGSLIIGLILIVIAILSYFYS